MSAHAYALAYLPAIVLLAVGLWLFHRGNRPRRVGYTPHCRHCEYIFTGIITGRDGVTCPECGTAHTCDKIMYGERPRKPTLIAIGAVLTIAGGITGGGAILTTLGRIRWYEHLPVKWVLDDFTMGNIDSRQRAFANLCRRAAAKQLTKAQQGYWVDAMLGDLESRAKHSVDREREELARYAEAKSLSPGQMERWINHLLTAEGCGWGAGATAAGELIRIEEAGQIPEYMQASLIERALKEDSDVPQFLRRYVGNWFDRHALTPAQEKRLLEWKTSVQVYARGAVGKTDSVPVCVQVIPGESLEGWTVKYEITRIWVDDVPTPFEMNAIDQYTQMGAVPRQVIGGHRLKARVKLSLGHGDISDPVRVRVYSEERDTTADFDVVATVPGVTLLKEPSKYELAGYIRCGSFGVQSGPGEEGWIAGSIWVRWGLPVEFAFDVFARADGFEYKLGTLCEGGPMYVAKKDFKFHPDAKREISKIDIILRSSIPAARTTVFMTHIWNGEITFNDVPVTGAAEK
jgi:hypothetical protein